MIHSNHTPGGPLLYLLEGHPWAPTSVKVVPDQGTVVSASNMITIWDLTTGEHLKDIKIQDFTGVLKCMSLSDDAKVAVACCNKQDIYIFNLVTGKYIKIAKPCSGFWGKQIIDSNAL